MTGKTPRPFSVVRLSILIILSVPLAYGLTHLWAMWLERGSVWEAEPSEHADSRWPSNYVPLSKDNPPSPESFQPQQVVRPFPAITEIPTLTVEQAEGKIDDVELVLGVEVDGEARAYPINMLTGPSREIFNDQLGGAAIAATW